MPDSKDEILHKADIFRDEQKCHTFPQVSVEFEYPPAHLVEIGYERLLNKIHKLSDEEKLQILQFLWCELNYDSEPKNLNQLIEGDFEATDKALKVKLSQNLVFFVTTALLLFGVKIILTTYLLIDW